MISKTSAECAATPGFLCFWQQYDQFVTIPFVVGGHVVYIFAILALRWLMTFKKTPFELKLPMMLYNLTQVFFSGMMTVGLAPFLLNNIINLNGLYNDNIEFWILVHYATKFLDMFDTVWMVLRKKDRQLSFLHVYHHLTIGLIWGLLLHSGNGNGTAFYGAWINSLVHTLMYFHYFITSFGINNPLKKYLTQFQMFQFGTCILHAVVASLYETQFPRNWMYVQLCYHFTLLYLFARFYMSEIATKKKAPKKAQ